MRIVVGIACILLAGWLGYTGLDAYQASQEANQEYGPPPPDQAPDQLLKTLASADKTPIGSAELAIADNGVFYRKDDVIYVGERAVLQMAEDLAVGPGSEPPAGEPKQSGEPKEGSNLAIVWTVDIVATLEAKNRRLQQAVIGTAWFANGMFSFSDGKTVWHGEEGAKAMCALWNKEFHRQMERYMKSEHTKQENAKTK